MLLYVLAGKWDKRKPSFLKEYKEGFSLADMMAVVEILTTFHRCFTTSSTFSRSAIDYIPQRGKQSCETEKAWGRIAVFKCSVLPSCWISGVERQLNSKLSNVRQQYKQTFTADNFFHSAFIRKNVKKFAKFFRVCSAAYTISRWRTESIKTRKFCDVLCCHFP